MHLEVHEVVQGAFNEHHNQHVPHVCHTSMQAYSHGVIQSTVLQVQQSTVLQFD
jgi:hypothetical protein